MTKRHPTDTPRHRGLRLAILGVTTARCEKCLADCSNDIAGWVLVGLCAACDKPKK